MLIKQAFDRGYPEAMFRLAFKYKLGLDIEQDLEKAQHLLLKSASAGHEFAMWMLAICFSKGKWGFVINRKRAGYWYMQLWKKWLEDAGQGDIQAKEFLEIYQVKKKCGR